MGWKMWGKAGPVKKPHKTSIETREWLAKTENCRSRRRKGRFEIMETDWACENCGWPGGKGDKAFIPSDDDLACFCCSLCATAALSKSLFG